MKVLFNCHVPFSLAHGGAQIQIERTRAALSEQGVDVDFLRWWDESQRADLIHFFGDAPYSFLQQARERKVPVVVTSYFSETCNRSSVRLATQAFVVRTGMSLPFGRSLRLQLKWHSYELSAHNIVGLLAERRVLERVYGVPPSRISVVPLGLSDAFLNATSLPRVAPRNAHLICTGTITSIKHSLELAQMARMAECPILFVGRPYSTEGEYWGRFKQLIDGQRVKYLPHVTSETEMIDLLRSARGFVLMSEFENWSLAAHEAAACGLPLLLRDQPWSRERFGNQVQFLRSAAVNEENVERLRRFHGEAPRLAAPLVQFHSWDDVARRLKAVYERVLNTSS